MYIRILALLAFTLTLLVAPSWAQLPCGVEEVNCFTFDATHTSRTYSEFGDGSALTVQFETVLTSFDLRAVIHIPKPTDSSCVEGCDNPIVLDGSEFSSGTLCVTYPINSPGVCEQYDLSGHSAFSSGPNGVPVKNVDYKGLITLTLTYLTASSFVVNTPAFGHAPGDITTFTENILTSYSVDGPPVIGPTMSGKSPSLSSLVALDEPLTEKDFFCGLALNPTNNKPGLKPEVEVTLKIASTSTCTPGIRDKSASLSVSNDSSGTVIFPLIKNAEGNKFHWDNKNGLNEYDINTDGLADGTYTVTVFSSKISPQNAAFCLSGGFATLGACP
jgi:hypothetical protein